MLFAAGVCSLLYISFLSLWPSQRQTVLACSSLSGWHQKEAVSVWLSSLKALLRPLHFHKPRRLSSQPIAEILWPWVRRPGRRWSGHVSLACFGSAQTSSQWAFSSFSGRKNRLVLSLSVKSTVGSSQLYFTSISLLLIRQLSSLRPSSHFWFFCVLRDLKEHYHSFHSSSRRPC